MVTWHSTRETKYFINQSYYMFFFKFHSVLLSVRSCMLPLWICICCSMTSKSTHSEPDIHTFHMVQWRWSQLLVCSKLNSKQSRIFTASTENSLARLPLRLNLTEQRILHILLLLPSQLLSRLAKNRARNLQLCSLRFPIISLQPWWYHCHHNNNINP